MRSLVQATMCLLAIAVPAAPAWAGRGVPKHKARAANVACPDADMPPAPGAGARYDAARATLMRHRVAASGLRALRSEPRLAAARATLMRHRVAAS